MQRRCQQENQVKHCELRAKDRTFNPGETILARKYLKGPKWVVATVIAQADLVLHCPHGRGRHLEKAHRSVTVE